MSAAGAKKYCNGKFPTRWREIPEADVRLADAQVRHMLEEAKDILVDDETQCLHLAQQAWNALARLELFLGKTKKAIPAAVCPFPGCKVILMNDPCHDTTHS